MKIITLILDILIYFSGAMVMLVGGYVVLRYFKGEARKRKRKSQK